MVCGKKLLLSVYCLHSLLRLPEGHWRGGSEGAAIPVLEGLKILPIVPLLKDVQTRRRMFALFKQLDG